jgi:plastocyanin
MRATTHIPRSPAVPRPAARPAPRRAGRTTCLALALLATCAAHAGELVVSFVDETGTGVAGAVVTLRPLAPPKASAPSPARSAVMDQVDLRFSPAVLVVPVGTPVSFPNSDLVSHQVYSFSAAKKFQLPLYRGTPYPPVVFDAPGIVTLGCNIHDDMVAHIFVTDAPYYGLTRDDGRLSLPKPAPGEYEVSVWHPRLRPAGATLTQRVQVDPGDGARTIELRSDAPLRAERAPPRRAGWDGY